MGELNLVGWIILKGGKSIEQKSPVEEYLYNINQLSSSETKNKHVCGPRTKPIFTKLFLFSTRILLSTAIKNTSNIFFCLVKSTHVAFLALTLIITNYCSSIFISVTWHP